MIPITTPPICAKTMEPRQTKHPVLCNDVPFSSIVSMSIPPLNRASSALFRNNTLSLLPMKAAVKRFRAGGIGSAAGAVEGGDGLTTKRSVAGDADDDDSDNVGGTCHTLEIDVKAPTYDPYFLDDPRQRQLHTRQPFSASPGNISSPSCPFANLVQLKLRLNGLSGKSTANCSIPR